MVQLDLLTLLWLLLSHQVPNSTMERANVDQPGVSQETQSALLWVAMWTNSQKHQLIQLQ